MHIRTYLPASLLLTLCGLVAVALPAEAQPQKLLPKESTSDSKQKIFSPAAPTLGDLKGATVCAFADKKCIETGRNSGSIVVLTEGKLSRDENGRVEAAPDVAKVRSVCAAAAIAPGEEVWANYNFAPGNRLLFYDNYSSEYIGDFPGRLKFRRGTMELVDWRGGRALRAKTDGVFDLSLSEVLPEKFTVDFDFYAGDSGSSLQVHSVDRSGKRSGAQFISVAPNSGVGVASYSRGGVESQQRQDRLANEMLPVRIAADGGYVKVYVGEERVANVPNADLGRTDRLQFVLDVVDEQPVFIGPIRVTEDQRNRIYHQVARGGQFVTRGIRFAVGSDRILPESTPTLEAIGRMMKSDPDLRLRVEGHTDNTGSAVANQRLSEKRAQAVVDYLVRETMITPSRLEAAGFGQARPAADNTTPEGRWTNRRVELVVL